MDSKLKNKVFMVSAASKGLGKAIASSLSSEGALVSIGSRNLDLIKQTAIEINSKSNNKVLGFQLDVSDPESIINWFKNTYEEFGRVDGLVVNAGGPKAGKFDDFDDKDWQESFNLTLLSAVRLIREGLSYFKQNNHSTILTITSSSIKEPIDGLILSNVFRSGVSSLVKTLSRELAKDNIRINNLVPGRIETDRVSSLDAINAEKRGVSNIEQKETQEKLIPLGRYGTPQEFASAAVFLLSDLSSYMTGSTMIVDGGKTRSIN